MVITPTNASFYVINTNNGVTSTTFVHNHNAMAWNGSSSSITLGNDTGGSADSRVFNGVIDEAAVFNYALTASQLANLAGVPFTTTALASSKNPSVYKDSISFTANVTPSVATGTVQFLTNGVLFDTEPLSGGSATSVATTALPPGTNTIAANYAGGGGYPGSTNTLSQVVTVNTNAATVGFGSTVTGAPGSQSLNFSWDSGHLGWQLYTNSVGLSATGSWFPVTGSASVTSKSIGIIPTKTNVFFQLRYP